VLVSAEPIDLAALVAGVSHAGAGAWPRSSGRCGTSTTARAVVGIDYEAYGPMADRELAVILDEAAARWPGARPTVRHRVGYLAVGEVSVGVAVSAPHRAAAFDACRYVVEELKRRAPVWKREHYADGRRAWVDGRVDAPRLPAPAEP
jgi:molybdopterin synthase catalytic subunit